MDDNTPPVDVELAIEQENEVLRAEIERLKSASHIPVTWKFEHEKIRGMLDGNTGHLTFLQPENLSELAIVTAYRINADDRVMTEDAVIVSKATLTELALVRKDGTFGCKMEVVHTISEPELNKRLENANEALKIQRTDGNWDFDPYMHGMLNGMEFVLATIEGRECEFRDAPAKWRTGDLTEFVEDLAKTGLRFDLNPTHDLQNPELFFHDYIRRMDDSIRGRAMDALTFEPRDVLL